MAFRTLSTTIRPRKLSFATEEPTAKAVEPESRDHRPNTNTRTTLRCDGKTMPSEEIDQFSRSFNLARHAIFINMNGHYWTTPLSRCETVEKLELPNCRLTPEIISQLVALYPSVETLDLGRYPERAADANLFKAVVRWQRLKSITFHQWKTNDADSCLDVISAHCQYLIHLNFQNHPPVSDGSLEVLTSLRGATLKSLSLNFGKVTGKGYQSLRRCVNLTKLNLYDAETMTNAELAILRELKFLKGLYVTGAHELFSSDFANLFDAFAPFSLTYLRIENCVKFHDRVVKAMAKSCPHLKSLDLCDLPSVTDRGIRAILPYCENLESLWVCRLDRVTEEGIAKVEQQRDHLFQQRRLAKETDLTFCSF